MPKVRDEDKDKSTSRDGVTVAFRLAPIEDRALKALITMEQAEIDARGAPYRASAASVLRTLLRAKAVAAGVWDATTSPAAPIPTSPAAPIPTSPAEDPRQQTIFEATNAEKSAPTPTPQAQNRTPKRAMTSDEGVAWLRKAVKAGAKGKELGLLLGMKDGVMVSRWLNGTHISEAALSKLEAILPRLRKDYDL